MNAELIEKIHLWLEQGYKEEILTNGNVLKTPLSNFDKESLQKLVQYFENPPPRLSREEILQKMDGAVEARRNEARSSEALAWLELENADGIPRGFAGGLGSLNSIVGVKAKRLIERIYGLGAVRIEIIAPPTFEQGAHELTGEAIIITLPVEKELRRRLFQWQKQFCRKQGFDSVQDLGQKYLYVKWD